MSDFETARFNGLECSANAESDPDERPICACGARIDDDGLPGIPVQCPECAENTVQPTPLCLMPNCSFRIWAPDVAIGGRGSVKFCYTHSLEFEPERHPKKHSGSTITDLMDSVDKKFAKLGSR